MLSKRILFCIYNNFTHSQTLRKIHANKVRLISISFKKWSQDNISQDKNKSWIDKIKQLHKEFQVFVGSSDIKKVHERMTDLSNEAQGFASIRRELTEKLEDIHEQRNVDYEKMIRMNVESEEYARLQDKDYKLKNQLRIVRKEYRTCERNERENFEQLFLSMKMCNRKESDLRELRKYWAIIASIISAILASVITSLIDWTRLKELKEITKEVTHKEIKISSQDLNQIEATVKEHTEDILKKYVDKHHSSSINKAHENTLIKKLLDICNLFI